VSVNKTEDEFYVETGGVTISQYNFMVKQLSTHKEQVKLHIKTLLDKAKYQHDQEVKLLQISLE
jgi:hypothetical protein